MAFKRTNSPTFSSLVTVNIPNDKGGYDKSTFMAYFSRPTTDEANELRRANLSPEDLVRRQLVNWEMRDADTNELVPFSQVELEAALQIQPFPVATAVAFWEGISGARAKN